MGTDCASLPADLFLYSCESEFLDNMMRNDHRKLARSFNMCYRYTDDLIVFNNKKFGDYVKEIYPSQLTVEKSNTSDDLVNYLSGTPGCVIGWFDFSLRHTFASNYYKFCRTLSLSYFSGVIMSIRSFFLFTETVSNSFFSNTIPRSNKNVHCI